jgi:uncharacterized protein (DUF488 family)
MNEDDRNGNVLYTIGYEGRSIDEFVACLKSSSVTIVVDIRELPLSRKRGFSKSPLKERLEQEGLSYLHIRELGSPREIRNKLHENQDYQSFFESFVEYLSSKSDALERVHEFAFHSSCCLMCYERDAGQCHRSVVAQKIIERDSNGLSVVNI